MRHRYAGYRPAGPRVRAFRLLRSAHLNIAGWSAILALCLAGAMLGYLIGRLLQLSREPSTAAGALSVLAMLVTFDRRRHARTQREQ
ncbi:hypothetical protein [Actinoplanes sp. G11-F43]|uniref:hypothetical protein n=1 Tax=Actinoplanes sp. G11-F43 TaxID=3424130 RepID=UPI003D34A45F